MGEAKKHCKSIVITVMTAFVCILVGLFSGIMIQKFVVPEITGYWSNSGVLDDDTQDKGAFFGEDNTFKLVDRKNNFYLTGTYSIGKLDLWDFIFPGNREIQLKVDNGEIYNAFFEVVDIKEERILRIFFDCENSNDTYYIFSGLKTNTELRLESDRGYMLDEYF